MKSDKKRNRLSIYFYGYSLVSIFTFMLTVSGCAGKGKEQEKVYQETGMFEWAEEAVREPEEALHLAEELEITRWYQETDGTTEAESTREFVKVLHDNNIEVYALLGAVDWGYEENGATLLAHLEKIVQYNVQSSEKERFDGVMLDIEPYISDYWKENPEEYMDRYISCMKKGYKFAQKNHLRTAICIPRHYDDQGLTVGLEELIKETCDEVAVMNYSCGNEIEAIKTEAVLSEKYGKELHCILEFQEVGKHGLTEKETYRNKGIDNAKETWEELQKEYENINVIRDYHWSSPVREMLEEKDAD